MTSSVELATHATSLMLTVAVVAYHGLGWLLFLPFVVAAVRRRAR